jgi:hypothetical protein
MIDLTALTKDYYSKSEIEKEKIKKIIYNDLIQITIEEGFNYYQLREIVENFNKKVIETEDYEMADIMNSVFDEVGINHFRVIKVKA